MAFFLSTLLSLSTFIYLLSITRLADLLGYGEELRQMVQQGHEELDKKSKSAEGASLGIGGVLASGNVVSEQTSSSPEQTANT